MPCNFAYLLFFVGIIGGKRDRTNLQQKGSLRESNQEKSEDLGTDTVGQVEATCDGISECNSISVQASTNQMNVSGLAAGLVLQNITYINGTAVTASDNSSNNTSLMTFTSGTLYIIHYGNDSNSCCYNVTTKPLSVKSPQSYYVTSTSVFLNWSKPDEYQSSYSYRVQTNVTSSSTLINNMIVTNESTTIVSLTPGETYTFLVYTRAADNVTESDPVSLTTCTVPGQAVGVTVNSYKSVNSLAVNWTAPAGKASYYNVSITGDVTNTIQTNITQVNFTNLLPGRNYTVTVQTVSGNCSSAIITVTEATYPSPPGNITFITIWRNTTTLSWGEPVNMTGVTKSYNIIYYWNASSTNTMTSNSTIVTLLSLKSGSNYTITVVTVGVRGYQSTSVSRSIFTKPLPVKSPQSYNVTTTSVSLNWSKPDEYQSSYSYRVQTNVTSPSTLINNMIVTNESAAIVSLTPGETYTFLVYTRAADNVTESDPVSLTTCIVPGQAVGVTVNNSKSVNSLAVIWTAPAGKASYYNVTITGDVNWTIQTNITQANFTDLLPGRNYTVTVQTVSGSCSSAIITVTEATYPSPPGNITFTTIGTNTTTLSWGEPMNMTGVTKSYNINYYWDASFLNTTTSNSTYVTLLNLKSGSNYTVTVVTVGVRGYQSMPVSGSVFTKPLSVKSPQFYNVTATSAFLNWSKPDEYQSSYSYRVQTNVASSSTLINNMIVTNESATIVSLTPGETYTFLVYTRAADNVTESDPVSLTTCTVPGQAVGVTVNNYKSVNSLAVNWTAPAGKVSYYNVTITGDVTNTIQTNTIQANFTGLSPGRNYTVTVQTVSVSCSSAIITVTEATYPSPPGNITFITIGTNTTTLSWGEPVNMTGVTKSYNISYYWNASSTYTTSNSPNVTLLSLKSGSNYPVTVVTVGVRGYQSTSVSRSMFTKPLPVKSLQSYNVTSTSMSLNWSKPDEYQSSYRYRVQTNVTSPSTLINNTIVTNESATIVSLTPGETYTFLVYTRAADNVTESDPVSLTTCTVPGVTVNNYKSVNSLVVNWTVPSGKVSYYNITITGDVNNTTQTNTTQANFTGLSPGRNYTVTVQTVNGNCSSAIATVTEATYPTPPGIIAFNTIRANAATLSWEEPTNMTGLVQSYNINYWNASSSSNWTQTSYSNNVTLQSLTSGTNYTISVVTVGVRGYQSTPVTASVYTKPWPVLYLRFIDVTSNAVTINWSKPSEYQSSYSYRVQINVASSSTMINNTIVTNESTTILNLTPGETYTFLVYTRAADNVTESDPVSIKTCTGPGQVSAITLNNYKSINTLGVNWPASSGKVDYYVVSITGDVINAMPTYSTQTNFTGLLPGRDYTVIVQKVSGNCSQTSMSVMEATYPSSPGNITFITIGTNTTTLSWGEPVNMTGVTKSYNITYYWNASSPNTTTSNSTNVTLLSLKSGSNYTVTVVTVGVRGYQSTFVSRSIFTMQMYNFSILEPLPVKSPQSYNVTTTSVSLNWSKPDEYQSSYSYRVQTNVTSPSTLINNTIVTNESVTIVSLTPGETYTFLVYTRAADNVTESDPVSLTTCTVPGQAVGVTVNNYKSVNSLAVNWTAPAGKVSYYNVTITGDVNRTIQTNITQENVIGLSPGRNYTVTVQTNAIPGLLVKNQDQPGTVREPVLNRKKAAFTVVIQKLPLQTARKITSVNPLALPSVADSSYYAGTIK
ncbi:receptor-type tyrosine-protein phosphatase beta-like [Mantella aurantiaca]